MNYFVSRDTYWQECISLVGGGKRAESVDGEHRQRHPPQERLGAGPTSTASPQLHILSLSPPNTIIPITLQRNNNTKPHSPTGFLLSVRRCLQAAGSKPHDCRSVYCWCSARPERVNLQASSVFESETRPTIPQILTRKTGNQKLTYSAKCINKLDIIKS